MDLQLAALSQRRACPLGSEELACLQPASACRLESLGFWGGLKLQAGAASKTGPRGIVREPVSRSESPSSGLGFGRPLLWSAGWANAAGPPPLVPPSLARPSPAPSAALSLLFRERSPPSGPRTRVHNTLYPLPYVASGGDARRALGPPVCWGGSASFYRSWPGEETWAGGWHALGSGRRQSVGAAARSV